MTARSRAYFWPTLLFLGCGYALANGLAYGVGNHWQYLLHGRHLLDPTFLANDWLTSQTPSHHAAFAWLIAVLGRVASLDVALAGANAVFAMICLACVYAIAARHYERPILVTALTLLIIVFSPQSTIGMSAMMMPYFQPSTIGGVGLFAAMTCVLYGRYKTAGTVLFVAGLFHLSYAIWAGVIFGAVVLVNRREIGLRRGLYLLAPIVLTLAYHLPFALASRTPEEAAYSAAAAHILHDIYMPAHSRPRTWGSEPFIRFGSVMAAGVIAAWAVKGSRPLGRIGLSFVATIGAIIGLGIILTLAIQVDVVALLLPYRLAPQLIFASYIACGGAIVTTALSQRWSWPKTLGLWTVLGVLLYGGGIREAYSFAWIAAAVAVLVATRLAEEHGLRFWKTGAVSLALLAIASWGGASRTGECVVAVLLGTGCAWRAVRLLPRLQGRLRWLPGVGRVVLPLLIGALLMQIGAGRKDFLGPPPPADEQLLYEWCRERTGRGDVFMIPPSLSNFRLHAERAVVIDSRCIAILPSEVVEWYRRLADEGGADFGSLAEADLAYRTLDAPRARRVAQRYGAQYVVTQPEMHRGDLTGLRQVYVNPTFAAYELDRQMPR